MCKATAKRKQNNVSRITTEPTKEGRERMAKEEQRNTASNNGAFAEGFNPGPQQGEEGWTEV